MLEFEFMVSMYDTKESERKPNVKMRYNVINFAKIKYSLVIQKKSNGVPVRV